MPKNCKGMPQNAYKTARLEAAQYNDRFGSQEKAAELVLIDRNRLAKIEAGAMVPHPEEVLMMADQYCAPELKNHFCRVSCPLGRNLPPVDVSASLDRIGIRAVSALRKAEAASETLIDILGADGGITDDEIPRLMSVIRTLDDLGEVNENLKIWIEKNYKERGI